MVGCLQLGAIGAAAAALQGWHLSTALVAQVARRGDEAWSCHKDTVSLDLHLLDVMRLQLSVGFVLGVLMLSTAAVACAATAPLLVPRAWKRRARWCLGSDAELQEARRSLPAAGRATLSIAPEELERLPHVESWAEHRQRRSTRRAPEAEQHAATPRTVELKQRHHTRHSQHHHGSRRGGGHAHADRGRLQEDEATSGGDRKQLGHGATEKEKDEAPGAEGGGEVLVTAGQDFGRQLSTTELELTADCIRHTGALDEALLLGDSGQSSAHGAQPTVETLSPVAAITAEPQQAQHEELEQIQAEVKSPAGPT